MFAFGTLGRMGQPGMGGAVGAYAAYALALDFDDQSYWVDGTEYGASEGPDLAVTSSLAGWTFNDCTAAIVGGKLQITATGAAPYASKSIGQAPGARLHAVGTIQSSQANKGLISLYDGSVGTAAFAVGTAATPLDFEAVSFSANMVIQFQLRDNGGNWATAGAVGVLDATVKQSAFISQLPGYTYTRTGEQGAVKSQTYGAELVTNGDGSSLTGWTGSNANISLVGGKIRVDGQSTTQYAYQTISTVVGKPYRLTANITNISASVPRIRVGTGPLDSTNYFNGAAGAIDTVFVATATTTYITLFPQDGGLADYDDISVKEVYPTVEYFPANVPAINDQGYHAYGALTNYEPQSQNSAAWMAVSLSYPGTNTALAPDGTMTGDKLSIGASSSFGVRRASPNRHTASVFVRKPASGGATAIRATTNNTFAWNTGTSVKLVLTDQWQRLTNSAALTDGAATSYDCNFGSFNVDGSSDPDCVGDVEVWQLQLLEGNFPDGGPIIRTAGAAVGIGEGLMATTIPALASTDTLIWAHTTVPYQGADKRVLNIDDGSINNVIQTILVGGNIQYEVRAGGAQVVFHSAAKPADGTAMTFVARYLAGQWRAGYIVGGAITWLAAATTAAMPSGLTNVRYGNFQTGTTPLQSQLNGAFIKEGVFTTDADVLAAVAETL